MFQDARLAPRLESLKQALIGDVNTVLWVLMGTIGMVLSDCRCEVPNLPLARPKGVNRKSRIQTALARSAERKRA